MYNMNNLNDIKTCIDKVFYKDISDIVFNYLIDKCFHCKRIFKEENLTINKSGDYLCDNCLKELCGLCGLCMRFYYFVNVSINYCHQCLFYANYYCNDCYSCINQHYHVFHLDINHMNILTLPRP